MSRTTRGAVWIARAALAAALAFEVLLLHFPSSRAVDPSRAADVESVWTAAGRVGQAAGRRVPSALDPWLEWIPGDKVLHFLLFFPLGVLAAVERRLHGPLTLRRAGWLALAFALYALAGELAQILVERNFELGDVLANALGALVGIAAVTGFTRSPPRTPNA